MFLVIALLVFSLLSGISGQRVGVNLREVHPRLTWQRCTLSGGCTTQTNGAVVLDANWRWVHQANGFPSCYQGNRWDTTLCSSNANCALNCALDGADYSGTYGISTSSDALILKFSQGTTVENYGSRVFLLANDSKYETFKLLNQEFTFDVDVSQLPCGLNGALYFTSMDADGGSARFPTNKAGAMYGTGYCDSKCPRNLKFIDGQANCEGWAPSANDMNGGVGNYGSCCHEVDVWEGNSVSTALTVHPCTATQSFRCTGMACNGGLAGTCDPEGCDFNPYRMGDKYYYGRGKTIDSNSKFTVVTQFFTNNNSTSGYLSEIRRLYIQNGKVIQNSKVNIPGMAAYDSITSAYCTAQEQVLGDRGFDERGGLTTTTKAMAAGMVLTMSIWADSYDSRMLWLDGNYPPDADPSKPGVSRGDCPITSGTPQQIDSLETTARVIFSNIKFGDIGSTYIV